MASSTTVIDLTVESPPSSNSHRADSSDHSRRGHPGARATWRHGDANQAETFMSSSAATRSSRPIGQREIRDLPSDSRRRFQARRLQATNQDDRIEDDDDDEVHFVGMSESARRALNNATNEDRWRAFFGIDNAFSDYHDEGIGEVPPNLHIHEGLHRGPHSGRTYIAPGPPFHTSLDLFASAQLAFPALNARAHRYNAPSNRPASSGANQYTLGWESRGAPNPMDYMGALLRGLQGQRDMPSKIPEKFDSNWLYLDGEPTPGFATSLIEPPVDLDTYFDDKAMVTGPLPDTTPVCCGCKHALVLGGNGKQRMWVLPCGHTIDGRCMSRISGVPLPSDSEDEKDEDEDKARQMKGKGKAVEQPDEEPPAKSSRSSWGKVRVNTSTPKKVRNKRFVCSAEGCYRQAYTGQGHDLSCIEMFI